MVTLKAAWGWTREHAVLVGAVLFGVVAFVAGGFLSAAVRRPDKLVKDELSRIDAGNKSAKEAIEEGADAAIDTLENQHHEAIQALDAAQKDKLARLRRDPRAAARFLDSIARRRT